MRGDPAGGKMCVEVILPPLALLTTRPVAPPPPPDGSPRFVWFRTFWNEATNWTSAEFLKVNRLLQARVEQHVARTLDDAAAGVAETAVRRRRENRRVEPLIDGVRQRNRAVDVGAQRGLYWCCSGPVR